MRQVKPFKGSYNQERFKECNSLRKYVVIYQEYLHNIADCENIWINY